MNIRIVCSVRPLLEEKEEKEEDLYPIVDRRCIALPPKDEFEFSAVFDGDLRALSSDLVSEAVDHLMKGHDYAILFYGPTGAGKTTAFCDPNEGVVWAMIKTLYTKSATLSLEAWEIYNGKVTPILKKEEDIEEDEIHDIMGRAVAMRKVGATLANNRSSRGHGIFTLGGITKGMGRITFIDLAGSERLSQTGTDPARIQEAIHVNKSLTALRDVVEQSAAGKFVPYRNSPLTLHLRSVLAHPDSAISIVLCCNRSRAQSIETLRFGRTATKIRPCRFVPPPKSPQQRPREKKLAALEKELEATRTELKDCQERLSKVVVIVRKCRLCGVEGHNRRTCLKRRDLNKPEGSTQGDSDDGHGQKDQDEGRHDGDSAVVLVRPGGPSKSLCVG